MALAEPGPDLGPADLERHTRTIAVRGIGELGQRRLAAARVLVVGAGGLGSPVLSYLAAAGVGRIVVVDDDVVELANLQRQVLHTSADVGRPKVESAADHLRALNPGVDVVPVRTRFTGPLPDGSADPHLIVDCTDNVPTRLAIADTAAALDVPVVWGAVAGSAGQVTVWWASRGYALRDLWPEDPSPGTIADLGALGPLVGVVGAHQAIEAVKLLTGAGEPLLGRILHVDALTATVTEIPLAARSRTQEPR